MRTIYRYDGSAKSSIYALNVLCSLPESELEGVIVELASELVVVLGFGLAESGSALSEHGWEVISLGVNLLFAAGSACIALEVVGVDNSLNILAHFVHHVVSGSEITLLEVVLSGTVTDENVILDSTSHVSHRVSVVLVLLLSLDHLRGLLLVLVDSR